MDYRICLFSSFVLPVMSINANLDKIFVIHLLCQNSTSIESKEAHIPANNTTQTFLSVQIAQPEFKLVSK